jgi:phosphoribosylformylglycinamidine synthase
VPGLPAWAPGLYQALHRAMKAGWVRACHDLSEGGLAVAAAEMCIGGRLGLELALDDPDPWETLFAEVNGSLLAEIRPPDCESFETLLKDFPVRRVGAVTALPRFSAAVQGKTCLSLSVAELVSAWKRSK